MESMQCPKCNSQKSVKNGYVGGIQRYKCKSCGYNYREEGRGGTPEWKKHFALELAMEGIPLKWIGKFLEISDVTISYWLKHLSYEGKRGRCSGERRRGFEVVTMERLRALLKSVEGRCMSYGMVVMEWKGKPECRKVCIVKQHA